MRQGIVNGRRRFEPLQRVRLGHAVMSELRQEQSLTDVPHPDLSGWSFV